jgi:hypothetical protein
VRLAGLALVATLALVAAGFGGGAEQLSQSDFDAKVASICAGYTNRAAKELEPVPGNPLSPKATPEQLAKFGRLLEHVATLFGRQLDDLQQLGPPSGSKERYTQVLRLYAQIEAALGRGARAARKGDKVGVLRAEDDLTALGKAVDDLGFRCE